MDQSLTVFVCSTYSDLIEEREATLDAIRRLQLLHDSMEYFGARHDLPIETCLEEVRKSDVLVVIVGHRYGSFVPGMSISFSEAEYREGYRLRKPCLVYVRDENVPILPKHIERDPEKNKLLDLLKDDLRNRHTVATFKSPQDLSLSVAADLGRTVQALEQASKTVSKTKPVESSPYLEIDKIIKEAISLGIAETTVISTVRQSVASLLRARGILNPKVFFSYSHSDKDIVRAIADGLRDEGIDVWIDEHNIRAGDSILKSVLEGLKSADFVAYFMSENSAKSEWAIREVNAIIAERLREDKGTVIIPILLDTVKIPSVLRDVLYLDVRDKNVSKAVEQLLKAIKYHLNKGT